MSREVTNKLLELQEAGVLSWEAIGRAALISMSEDDVAQMAHANELLPAEEEADDGTRTIEVTVRLTISADADVSQLISEMDYEFKHDDIVDTEIVDTNTEI